MELGELQGFRYNRMSRLSGGENDGVLTSGHKTHDQEVPHPPAATPDLDLFPDLGWGLDN